jgi:hypothetical protein
LFATVKTKMKRAKTKKRRNCLIILLMGLFGCISSFEPNYKGESNLLVVDGSLIKGVEKQVIKISRSASISAPEYIPVENCKVKVVDNSGTEFYFTEETKGKYVACINDAFLSYGKQYKLVFSTPDGKNYESSYESLMESAPVDSVYCIKESRYDSEINQYSINGLQFYADLNAPQDASRYYRWMIEETWEVYGGKIWGIYDGKTVEMNNWPADSLYYCWRTKFATGIYTCSTAQLSSNTIKKIPLHYMNASSNLWGIKYCATVQEYALTKDAYDYWHQKEAELNESGQIYTTQPGQVKSNITNTSDAEETVLGFFWVSSCSLKRLFLRDPFGLGGNEGVVICEKVTVCTDLLGQKLEDYLLSFIKTAKNLTHDPPYYIYYTPENCYNFALTDGCVDCRLIQGYPTPTTQKPDFW